MRLRLQELNQLQRLQARVAVPADDDVVVHGDAERLGDIDDRLRHVDIGARGRWIAARMIVHQYDSGRGQLQRALDHLAWIDRRNALIAAEVQGLGTVDHTLRP